MKLLVDEKITRRIQSDSLRKGFKVAIQLGFGKPDKVIPEIVNKGNFDVLVMGTHGHTGFKDLILEQPLTN
jgi:manganese transport protein